MSLKQLLCRHDTVTIFRAHAKSDFAREHGSRVAWVDRLNVHNFIVCHRCDQVLNTPKLLTAVYDSKDD